MHTSRVLRLLGLLGIVLVTVVGPAVSRADDNRVKRIAHVVKYGSAKDLAKSLNAHFKGVAEVEALPEPNGNILLLRVDPAAFDEVVKLLGMLDRPPRTIAVDVWIADVPLGKDDKPKEEINEKELTGTPDAVHKKLQELQRKGQLESVKRIQMTALENQTTSLMLGEQKGYTVGVTVTGTGREARSISYRQLGTQIKATPRIGPDKAVTLELVAEDARMHVPEDAPAIGTGADGKPIRATAFLMTKFDGKVNVPSGQTAVVQGVKMTAPGQSLLIVGARVVEDGGK
jgi:type II secretory pathway component GspD/PulD (secretin)